jgi:hypothetical protein
MKYGTGGAKYKKVEGEYRKRRSRTHGEGVLFRKLLREQGNRRLGKGK